MSSRVPDFSATFKLVDHQLETTERRLDEHRRKGTVTAGDGEKRRVRTSKKKTSAPTSKPEVRGLTDVRQAEANRRSVRRNLTLKVLEENEIRFNQLFHQLQLSGISRRKQDLADEALTLLFSKYEKS